MVKRVKASKLDQEKLISLPIDTAALADDFFDYKNVVIQKPWGKEYLIFENKNIAIWVMHIKKGHGTSMHCHPNKNTGLVVLSGGVKCSTLHSSDILSVGHGLQIDKCVFHSTEALYPEYVTVMEVETPTNKKDLVRLEDNYGRQMRGYEGEDAHINLDSSMSHFHDEEERYDIEKRIGDCYLSLVKCPRKVDFKKALSTFRADIATLVSGGLYSSSQNQIVEIGGTVAWDALRDINDIDVNKQTELLLIRKLS